MMRRLRSQNINRKGRGTVVWRGYKEFLSFPIWGPEWSILPGAQDRDKEVSCINQGSLGDCPSCSF